MDGKRRWILNSYNGHAARELKMREHERTLTAIVEAWDKHDLLVHGLPEPVSKQSAHT
jgi:hypothetical protein